MSLLDAARFSTARFNYVLVSRVLPASEARGYVLSGKDIFIGDVIIFLKLTDLIPSPVAQITVYRRKNVIKQEFSVGFV